jgi:serine/threonine protein kinase
MKLDQSIIGPADELSVFGRYLYGLKRTMAIPENLVSGFSGTSDHSGREAAPKSNEVGAMWGSLLRVWWLLSPWEHYTSVEQLSSSGGSTLVYRNGAYFSKATMRVFPYPRNIQSLQLLSDIRHPNIAKIYDVYCHEGRLFVATEYLELSLPDLDFHLFEMEEWEIATIIAEVS